MNGTLLNWPSLVEEAIRRRKAEGLTQRALAALAGVSVPTVNAFEKGSTKLRLDGVVAILTSLGLYESPPDPESLEAFVEESSRLPASRQTGRAFGVSEFAFSLTGQDFSRFTAKALRDIASDQNVLPERIPRDAFKKLGDTLEYVGTDSERDRYIRLTQSGKGYFRLGHREDAPPSLKPGTLFDVSLPVLSASQYLKFVAAAARAAGGNDAASIDLYWRYSGLAGRTLLAWVDPLLSVEAGGSTRTDECVLRLSSDLARIGAEPVALITELLKPLYERFDGFDLQPDFVASQLGLKLQREGISVGPFAITKEMVKGLGDETLRELTGKLIEAEASALGIPSSAISLGGNQTARDGGIDAAISWKGGPEPNDRLPRRTSYFQCKATAMPPREIEREFRPKGEARPIFYELESRGGAYLLVTTDDPGVQAVEARVNAMRSALSDVQGAERVRLEFWGADQIARWCNKHIGIALWLLAKIGRPLAGWRPFGAWSSSEAAGHSYLIDENARASIRGESLPVRAALASMRTSLSLPGNSVRLVGMSGMGKTRLAEALFDDRLPAGPSLNPALAIYADAGLELAVGAAAMAEQLALSRIDAVLVVDNCAAATHRHLSEIVRQAGSRARLLTIDYDVGNEQPEDSLIVRLEQNSDGLLDDLVKQRFSGIPDHERERLAEFSGGNARIALGIARNAKGGTDLSKLSDDELLDRLFQHGRGQDDIETRRVAEVAALVWAFYIEDGFDHAAEHAILADQAQMSVERFYEHVSVLLAWGVAQQRGPQRAIMPPPLANRLAKLYLRRADKKALLARMAAGSERLLRSFARRLGQLHEERAVMALVADMMAEGGLLGAPDRLDKTARETFVYAAPANPVAALAAIGRTAASAAFVADEDAACQMASVLAHIAHDQAHFAPALNAMIPLVLTRDSRRRGQELRDLFLERFRPGLSMTMADGPTRLAFVDTMLADNREEVRWLAIDALDHMLDLHFSSSFQVEWGARSLLREWRPRLPRDEAIWFGAALERLQEIVKHGGSFADRARALIAQHVREFCDLGLSHLILPAMRNVKPSGYWEAGWKETQEALHFARGKPAHSWRSELAQLELDLRPKDLNQAFEAFVLGEPWRHWHPSGSNKKHTRNIGLLAQAVGRCLAKEGTDVPPYLARSVHSEGQNSTIQFGEGLARGTANIDRLWQQATDAYAAAEPGNRDAGVLIGILREGDRQDPAWGNARLDEVANDSALSRFIVHFHSRRMLSSSDIDRFASALASGRIEPSELTALMFGGRTKGAPAAPLADLLRQMMRRDDGLVSALQILQMRFFGDRDGKISYAPELVEVGKAILADPRLYIEQGERVAHEIGTLARVVVAGEGGDLVTAQICRAMRAADTGHRYWSESDWYELASALMGKYPKVVLDQLASGEAPDRRDYLLSAFFGGVIANDNDGRTGRTRMDGEAILEWVAVAPDKRAVVVAEYGPYTDGSEEDGQLRWNKLARRLIDIAPNPMAILNRYEARFHSGVSSGPFWLRFERRKPMIEELKSHVDRRVREWANQAFDRLEEEIEYWQTRDRESESLFE